MTTSTLTYDGREFVFLVALPGDRELVTSFRSLRAAGYSDPVLTSGRYAGTPVVTEANRIHSETGSHPIVLVSKEIR